MFLLIFLSYFICLILNCYILVSAYRKRKPDTFTVAELLLVIGLFAGNLVGTLVLFCILLPTETIEGWLDLVIYRPKSRGDETAIR
jgi:hypothetical protein